LKPQTTDDEFCHLSNFLYMKSEAEVDKFTKWVEDLGVKQVQAWWNHKVQNKWTLPSIIKSLSKINPDDWDRMPTTMNISESQHRWTNDNTGTNLSLLEAILIAWVCDERTAKEIKSSLLTGVLKNSNNSTFAHMMKNTAHKACASCKANENHKRNEALNEVNDEMVMVAEQKKHYVQRLKELKANKSAISVQKSSTKRKGSKVESSSSGRMLSFNIVQRESSKQ
ncbi:hypothetical protein BYT27DRAFT_7123357, partial [Phlegmacium glaucopus]